MITSSFIRMASSCFLNASWSVITIPSRQAMRMLAADKCDASSVTFWDRKRPQIEKATSNGQIHQFGNFSKVGLCTVITDRKQALKHREKTGATMRVLSSSHYIVQVPNGLVTEICSTEDHQGSSVSESPSSFSFKWCS